MVEQARGWQLEFSDSELLSVCCVGPHLQLVFSAAAVSRAGISAAREFGYVRGLTLTLLQVADVPPASLQACGRLRAGTLRISTGLLLRQIPIPFAISEPLTMELDVAHHEPWGWQAHGLHIQAPQDAVFLESLFC
jgi:hypothetical protein